MVTDHNFMTMDEFIQKYKNRTIFYNITAFWPQYKMLNNIFPLLAYVSQFPIKLQKLKHCILRVFCKINFRKHDSDKLSIVPVI